MNDSNQRLQFLNSYRTQLRYELTQMNYDQAPQITTKKTSNPADVVTGAVALVAVMLIFAGVFLA